MAKWVRKLATLRYTISYLETMLKGGLGDFGLEAGNEGWPTSCFTVGWVGKDLTLPHQTIKLQKYTDKKKETYGLFWLDLSHSRLESCTREGIKSRVGDDSMLPHEAIDLTKKSVEEKKEHTIDWNFVKGRRLRWLRRLCRYWSSESKLVTEVDQRHGFLRYCLQAIQCCGMKH